MPSELAFADVSKITGDGIFKPDNGKSQMSNKYYSLNTATNMLSVTGCLNSDEFNAQPFGTINIESVTMPNYVMECAPIDINVYSDSFLDQLIIANPMGATLTPDQMTPGAIDIL